MSVNTATGITTAKVSIADIVAKDRTKHGPPCWLCNIPERAEVEALKLSGRTMASIERALRTMYPKDSTLAKVAGHFQHGHHER